MGATLPLTGDGLALADHDLEVGSLPGDDGLVVFLVGVGLARNHTTKDLWQRTRQGEKLLQKRGQLKEKREARLVVPNVEEDEHSL